MSKLDKFFKAKDVKKEKEIQKSAPKPVVAEDENKNIVAGEFGMMGDFSGKTVTLTKEGVKMYVGMAVLVVVLVCGGACCAYTELRSKGFACWNACHGGSLCFVQQKMTTHAQSWYDE